MPGKVLEPLAGIPVIRHVVDRVSRATAVDECMVVTSIDPKNLSLVREVSTFGTRVFVGSEDDVLDRFWQATRLTDAAHVVRITADCPAIDPEIIDATLNQHFRDGNDYTSNSDPPSWPDGLDVEVMTRTALEASWSNAQEPKEREHVTPYMRTNSKRFRKGNYTAPYDLSEYRWTLDREADYRFLSSVFDRLFRDKPAFGYKDVLELLDREPELLAINSDIRRNEGY